MQSFPNVFRDYRLDFDEIQVDVRYFINKLVMERAKQVVTAELAMERAKQAAAVNQEWEFIDTL